MTWRVINGNSAEVLKEYPDNHFDAVITDPPYGISFLGKDWDSKKATETTSKLTALHNLPSGMKHTSLADDLEFQKWMCEIFTECARVLKPGGHLLAFSAARTYHHMAMAAQFAGLEIRDQIMWIYGSGFPKSQDVGRAIDRRAGKGKFTPTGATQMSGGLKEFPDGPLPRSEKLLHTPETPAAKQWSGWGTQLKPAHEPVVMARKPVKQSIIDNVQEWGVGALNIDACRVEYENEDDKNSIIGTSYKSGGGFETGYNPEDRDNKDKAYTKRNVEQYIAHQMGRFPANIIHDGCVFPEEQGKYFYQAKVSRAERNVGFNDPGPHSRRARDENGKCLSMAERKPGEGVQSFHPENGREANNHPTVKPVELMKYLIKLVTPPGGLVLDPFNGSGSTGMAAVELGYDYIGIEMDPKYCEIARRRIQAWEQYPSSKPPKPSKTKEQGIQLDLDPRVFSIEP